MYTPRTWVDVPAGTTPPAGALATSAANFNYMEAGIGDADTRITTQSNLVPHIPQSGNSFFAKGGVETSSRFNTYDVAGTSGRLWVSYFTAVVDTPIVKLAVSVTATAAVGTTLTRLAAFTVATDESITKVAQTASDTSLGASAYNVYERVLSTVGGFPSSYTFLAGTRYALSYLHVATTVPTISGVYLIDYAGPTAVRIIDGQTDIAGSYAVANLPQHFFAAWLRATS